MDDHGVVIGYCGDDRYDPLATPIAIARGRVIEGDKPSKSLNFPLGLSGPALVVGTSSQFPVAWVRGVPRVLRPAAGLPQGAASDANSLGVICGEVVRDFTGAQFPVVWPNHSAAGIRLRGLGDASRGACFAINEHNQVAGAIHNVAGYGFIAVRWDRVDRAPMPIGVLPGAMNGEGLCINNLGDVAGRSSFPDFTTEAFVYLDDTQSMVGLGNLGQSYSYARGINDARQVVGESAAADGVMRDLSNLIAHSSEPILYISNAVAIDGSGRIAAEAQVSTSGGPATRIALLTPVQ
jgi:probable HAF family extracellular repeat protein